MQHTDKDCSFELQPIGIVRSQLKRRQDCPFQGHEGGVQAWLEIDPRYGEGLDTIGVGSEVLLLT